MGQGSVVDWYNLATYLGSPRTYILAGSAVFMREGMRERMRKFVVGLLVHLPGVPKDIHPGGVRPFHEGKDGETLLWDCRFTYLGSPRTYILAGSAVFMREGTGKLCRGTPSLLKGGYPLGFSFSSL
jgi:hypothetical protein